MGLHEVRGAALRGCARILAGRYRVDALIGSGGAADVYRGLDLRMRRPVAVKVFRSGTGFDTEEAFRSEAVILARLQHPGLVTAFDAGHHDGDAFLVMQLIDGPTLKSRIAEGPLTCEAAAALGAALADALAHAHEAGIVHRDVKPSNIILDSAGRPHLTDFGISRLLDATTRSATGSLTGTAAYLSPEQVLGRPVGLPADVYALGLVLLESLTGRLEYDGGPLESAIARLHRPPALPDFLPDGLAALLRDMTSLEEQDRPTASDCAETLTRLAGPRTALPTASATRVALSAVPHTPAQHADTTHRRSSPPKAPWPTGPSTGLPDRTHRPASPRGRMRTRGAAAALAAFAAAGILLTESFADRDASGESTPEAAPSVPDRPGPSTPSDVPTRAEGAPSASATSPSRGPSSVATHRPSDSVPAHDVRRPADTSGHAAQSAQRGTSERAAADAAGKGAAKAPGRPPGQARKDQATGKKAARAR
ncbi:protein kinase domain-containing protein [Streptomyces sp. DT190]|uniref:serine/threonine-protein kinase n=1 Tax=unclassified Streptomyces TaxID=2593676 RepID=UPI003CF5E27A